MNGSKDFTEYSNDMDYIYKNVQEYNQNKKLKETKKWLRKLETYWYA